MSPVYLFCVWVVVALDQMVLELMLVGSSKEVAVAAEDLVIKIVFQ
jgi:hypothetical protein